MRAYTCSSTKFSSHCWFWASWGLLPTEPSAGPSTRSPAGFSRLPNDTAMQETLMRNILDRMAAAVVVVVALAGTAAAQSLTKITIATGVDPAFSQFYVAKEGGLFEKNGLD